MDSLRSYRPLMTSSARNSYQNLSPNSPTVYKLSREQDKRPSYTPFDANGQPKWPPFAECVMCKGRRGEDGLSDVQVYGDCDFMHLKCLHFICSEVCLQSLLEMGMGGGMSTGGTHTLLTL